MLLNFRELAVIWEQNLEMKPLIFLNPFHAMVSFYTPWKQSKNLCNLALLVQFKNYEKHP